MTEATPIAEVSVQPPRRFRRLRIAASVFFAVLTVALCVLWVRSSHRAENMAIPINGPLEFSCYSEWGTIQFTIIDYGPGKFDLSSMEVGPAGYVPPGQGFWWYLGFASYSWPSGSLVMLPYWLLSGVALCGAFVPWLHWSTRFSLRTLLIATTLLAVAMGLGVWLSS